MQRIGVLFNPHSDRSNRLSSEVVSWLQGQGLDTWRGTSEEGRDQLDALKHMDLLVALGGDGTVLRAARLAVPLQIPLLTVALGRLNFMAELGPNELPVGITKLLRGEGWYEQRSLIHAAVQRQGRTVEEFLALNEVVLSRGDISRTLTIEVEVDDVPLTTYRADGVIIATATGSTAYALSAGGPIMDPRVQALVLVPVAAHLTAVPAMVLHEDSTVLFRAHPHYHASFSVDGRDDGQINEGDEIRITRSQQVCTFARVQPPAQLYASFVQRLRRE
jgi:NAD+ kinase